MKIAEILQNARNNLSEKGIENAFLEALILLIHVTGFSKEQIIFNPESELSTKQQTDFLQAIKRRQGREPVSHIIEKREFYGLDFFVNKNVLDPRPDSETLIETVFQKFHDKNQQLKILELGVGSGCLIITLLKNYVNSLGLAVDISEAALQIAYKNAASNLIEKRLQLRHSDLFAEIKKEEKFDLIISNPPYIETSQINNLADEVRLFEPRLALDGGVDGLEFYRRIAKESANFLKQNGSVIIEIGKDQETEIAKIFASNNFKLNEQKTDLANVIRVMQFGF